jgi:thioredoxin-related protein
MTTAEQITSMIGYLPENQQLAILSLVNSLLPDDIATPKDLAAIVKAEREYTNGETVGFDEVMKELGLTEDDIK